MKIINYESVINSVVKEAAGKTTPKEFAKEIGIDLTPDKAVEIMKKYLKDAHLVEAKLSPKTRNLATLALLLATGFINAIQAQNEPLTVKTPFGMKTYEAKDLKRLSKTDPKTFAIVMEMAQKQQSSFSKRLYDRAMGYTAQKPPAGYEKATKGIEELSDEFGNEGRLITYTDGTKELEGDILHGGVSFRQKLERRNEIEKSKGPYAKENGPKVKL
jgi:hypothetical protein